MVQVDGLVYVNVMVLQQASSLDPNRLPHLAAPDEGGDGGAAAGAAAWDDWRAWLVPPGVCGSGPVGSGLTGGGAPTAATAHQRRAWRYWLERCAMALGHGPPTGLYDPAVRRRFRTMMGDEDHGGAGTTRQAIGL